MILSTTILSQEVRSGSGSAQVYIFADRLPAGMAPFRGLAYGAPHAFDGVGRACVSG